MIDPKIVAAHATDVAAYPSRPPFHPERAYPEAVFQETTAEPNRVYATVRECLRISGLDSARCGTAAWNPLRGLIGRHETVLIKPNLVKEHHPRDGEGWRYVRTQGSVIRAVVDYVVKALEGTGRVIIADAPQTVSSFAGIVRLH